MPSTYSSNLKLELMATGENSGTWGNITNTNLGTAIEQAIIGLGNVNYVSDANLTISITNSNAAQAARALVLNVTSSLSLTNTRELVVPTIEKQYIVQNNTTGGQSITVKTSAGTGITVPNGRKAHLYVNGTDVIQMFDFVDINGGAIDGTTVGASSASTGAFTSLTASGATTLNGAVALGDAAADLITVPGTVNSHVLFTDNLYDIGASGATRPRSLFLSTNITVGSLTSTRVPYASTGGLLVDSANMTFNGTRLTVADLADSGLTSGRVTYASTGGALVDSANLTFDGTILTTTSAAIGGTLGMTVGGALNGTTINSVGINLGGTQTLSINAGTANGVAYLNGSKVLTTGSALVFDGTNLGIGTSSPLAKVDARITSDGNVGYFRRVGGTINPGITVFANETGNTVGFDTVYSTSSPAYKFRVGGSDIMTLDASGNLGLGVTPSAWTVKAVEIGAKGTAIWNLNQQNASFTCNAYYDGTLRYGGTGLATQYQQAAGLHYWYTAASGTAGNAITFTQAMTLDASGRLGVGVTSPGYALDVGDTAGGNMFRFTRSGVELSSFISSGTPFLGTTSNTALALMTNSTERARITSGGDLLVGTTNTSASAGVGTKIRYDASSPDISIVCSTSTNSNTTYNLYSTGAGAFRFYVGLGGTVYATSTTISAISDQRLKENIQDLDAGLDKIMALKPRKFDWKAGKGKDIKGDRGFIAQEFEQVFPDLIDEWKDPAPEGEEPYKSVRADLIPVLVKAIQEQQALITSLTARIAALEAK